MPPDTWITLHRPARSLTIIGTMDVHWLAVQITAADKHDLVAWHETIPLFGWARARRGDAPKKLG